MIRQPPTLYTQRTRISNIHILGPNTLEEVLIHMYDLMNKDIIAASFRKKNGKWHLLKQASGKANRLFLYFYIM